MKPGYTMDRFIVYNEVEPTEDVSRKASGQLYNFKVPVHVAKLSDAQQAVYANNAPVVVMLLDVEKVDHLVIGTPTDPAVISFIPGANQDQLVIELASKSPIL
jgi:hypothetical protein